MIKQKKIRGVSFKKNWFISSLEQMLFVLLSLRKMMIIMVMEKILFEHLSGISYEVFVVVS